MKRKFLKILGFLKCSTDLFLSLLLKQDLCIWKVVKCFHSFLIILFYIFVFWTLRVFPTILAKISPFLLFIVQHQKQYLEMSCFTASILMYIHLRCNLIFSCYSCLLCVLAIHDYQEETVHLAKIAVLYFHCS